MYVMVLLIRSNLTPVLVLHTFFGVISCLGSDIGTMCSPDKGTLNFSKTRVSQEP